MLRIIYIITEMNARPDQNMSRAARARTLPIGKKLRIGKSVPASKQHLQRPVPSQLRRVRYPPVRTFRPWLATAGPFAYIAVRQRAGRPRRRPVSGEESPGSMEPRCRV